MSVPQLERRAVWIVDDSALDAERAAVALRDTHAVEVFPDGAAALERIAAAGKSPDLMIIDWVLPGISGVEMCRFLRRRPAQRSPALMLATAHNRPEQVAEGLEAGADDYLVKPYADAELRARVEALLRSRALIDRAERAEAAVRTLLTTAPDPLLAVDADGRLTFVNEAAAIMFDDAPERLVGRPLAELVPSLPPEVLGFAGTRSVRDVEVRGLVYAPTVRPVHTADGRQILVSLHNVTEQRQVEMRRLDFYSIIAHDLRSPLNSTLLRTNRILRGGYGLLPAELIADVRKMESTLRAQVQLINDFLELARLETVGYELTHEPLDLRDVVEATIEESRPLLDAGKLVVSTELPQQAARVYGDRRRLTQVVTNLLGNAIKFTPAGGGIVVRISISATEIETSIRDTGPGIAPHALATIFERFARGADTRDVVGTGLGLMIVREIVTAHGGAVGVESELGLGSTFWFRLPLLR